MCIARVPFVEPHPRRPEDEQSIRDEDIFHDGLTDFYHVWTLAEAFLLGSMPLPAASLLRWLKMYCQSNENPDVRFELDEVEAAVLEGTSVENRRLRIIHPG